MAEPSGRERTGLPEKALQPEESASARPGASQSEALSEGRQVDVRAVSSGGCQAGSRAFMRAGSRALGSILR